VNLSFFRPAVPAVALLLSWAASSASGAALAPQRLQVPADVLVLADGSLLISDDDGGAIYRVRYAP
jgi:glucose/arabinose dehydrogenase